MALPSLSPLLFKSFVSYANRAAALESVSPAPPPDIKEWKAFQAVVDALRKENEKLISEKLEVTGKLEAAVAFQDALSSRVSSLKEVNTSQQNDIKSLRAELAEVKEKYDRLRVDPNMELAAPKIHVLDIEVRLGPCLIGGLNILIYTHCMGRHNAGS